MIRQATPEDSAAISHLLKQLGYPSKITQLQEVLADSNKEAGSTVYVYERSGSIAGLITTLRFFYLPTFQTVTRVTALCVDEQHRSLGIGGELLNFVERLAIESGDGFVEVTCSIQRERTHQFYTKQGYAKRSYRFVKYVENG